MDSSSKISPVSTEEDAKHPVILSYHSLNRQNNFIEKYKGDDSLSAKCQSNTTSSTSNDEIHNDSSSFGLPYEDHTYAQLPGCPKKIPFDSGESFSSPLYSHSINDINSESLFSTIPCSDNSLDLLAKVAQAMAPVNCNSVRSCSLDKVVGLNDNDCSLLYTPDHDKLSQCMDYHWTAAQEVVVATQSSSSSPNFLKKTVSLIIPKNQLAAYKRINSGSVTFTSPHTSPGVSRSLSIPQESNVDLDSEPAANNSDNSLQPKTIKLLKPGSLPVRKLPPLRRYRYSGLGPNTSNLARVNSLGGNFQNPDNANNRIMLSPNNGLVFTYGAGIIPASNAHVGPIRCPCGYTHDDGYMIQCDKCKIWQHVDCVLRESNSLPPSYLCDACLPRNVNYNRAVNVQRQKLAQQQNKKLQEQEIAHQQNQIQQQLIARGINSTLNSRTSKRKQDLQSISGESPAEYEEQLNHADPNSSSSPNQPMDSTPCCSPTMGAATILTPNGSTVVPNNQQVIISSGQIPARNLFHSPGAGGMSVDDVTHSVTVDSELECGPLSPSSRFSSCMSNGHIECYDTVQSRSVYYDETVQQQSYNNSLYNNSVNATSFSHGLPINHADYDEIRENISTEELRQMFRHKYETGRLFCYNFKEPRPSHPPLTRVVALDFSRKRLEAARYITRSTVVMEYRGCLSLFDEYNYDYDYRKHYNPFVLFYNKLVNVSLCVDARHCGNSARFIRRSCHPNCEVFHIYSSGRIQLLIVANDDIAPGRELTLPFDFDFTKCRYQITCACGRKACQVARWYRSQDKSHYVPPSRQLNSVDVQNRNNGLSKAEHPQQVMSNRERYQKYLLKKSSLSKLADSVEDDVSGSDDDEVYVKSRKKNRERSPKSDIYEFSDGETKKEKKQRFLKSISNKNRQQRLQQQMSRKLNSNLPKPAKVLKSGKGRGRVGGLSSRTGPPAATNSSPPPRVKKLSGGSSTSVKRRASQAFSTDNKSQSDNNENEENTPTPVKSSRQRRQSSKSSDFQSTTSDKKDSSTNGAPPQPKRSREDIWLAEVLKRIERLEKKKKKSSEQGAPVSEDQPPPSPQKLSTNDDVKQEVEEEVKVVAEKENIEENDDMVIRYHRTSITELQEDIDAITRAIPPAAKLEELKDEETTSDNTSEVKSTTKEVVDVKRKRGRNNSIKSNKFVELNFNEFLRELKPKEEDPDHDDGDKEKSPPIVVNDKCEAEESQVKEEEQSPVKCSQSQHNEQEQTKQRRKSTSDESVGKSTSCRESRDDKWLRLQLKKIEEMEKKAAAAAAAATSVPAAAQTSVVKCDSLDDTLEEVVCRLTTTDTPAPDCNLKLDDKSSNKVQPRRRRQSSKEEGNNCGSTSSSANNKRSRKSSEDAPADTKLAKKLSPQKSSDGLVLPDNVEDEAAPVVDNSSSPSLMRKSRTNSQEIPTAASVRSDNDNLSSTSSDTDSDEENTASVPPVPLPMKRRSSAPTGPETRSRVTRSGGKPTAPLRTPATAIEYQDRSSSAKLAAKPKVLENSYNSLHDQECNLIVYKPQVENPMEKFSRSLSTNLPVNSNISTTSAVMPTPTKKRWLNQAIMEDEENNFSQDTLPQNNSVNILTTTQPAQFSLKKRLMAQYSVDDHRTSPPDFSENHSTEPLPITTIESLLPMEKPQTIATFASPTAKLPPKKATMKRREEERMLLEMRKIRVSLSEYRRRKCVQDSPSQILDDSVVKSSPDDCYGVEEALDLSGEDAAKQNCQELAAQSDEEAAVGTNPVDYSIDNEDCGPRTPSEPPNEDDDGDDEDDLEDIHDHHAEIVEENEAPAVMEEEEDIELAGGPKTPEMDDIEEEEDVVEDTTNDVIEEEASLSVNSPGDDKVVIIDDEELQKRIIRLVPSLVENDDSLSLNNILRRDEEIRDMQELKTLERQKNKLLYQLRSVEKVLPQGSEEQEHQTPPSQNNQVVATTPNSSTKMSSSSGGQDSVKSSTTKTVVALSPTKVNNSSCGRMPLTEKSISPSIPPVKKITPNLSALDAAIKNMNNNLKAQLAAAQQNIIRSSASFSNNSSSASTSNYDHRTKPRS